MKPISIEEKLGVNKFNVDEGNPHIIIKKETGNLEVIKKCVIACPAGLYSIKEDGNISFDFAGCLECGTCRVICAGTGILDWNYPQGTFGVEFRYG
ncbi:MAG: ferredoxin like protein [Clostridia bacterium]|nr:ferredoxin like protein [Clostridia bacterium]MDN5323541.1 ferredoxin like protein [Clostridia bacterium]